LSLQNGPRFDGRPGADHAFITTKNHWSRAGPLQCLVIRLAVPPQKRIHALLHCPSDVGTKQIAADRAAAWFKEIL
jgi:hypothetical protein